MPATLVAQLRHRFSETAVHPDPQRKLARLQRQARLHLLLDLDNSDESRRTKLVCDLSPPWGASSEVSHLDGMLTRDEARRGGAWTCIPVTLHPRGQETPTDRRTPKDA